LYTYIIAFPSFTVSKPFDISGKISKDRKTMTSIIKGRCTVILENGAKFKLDSTDNFVLLNILVS
jgi:hypothetical protein